MWLGLAVVVRRQRFQRAAREKRIGAARGRCADRLGQARRRHGVEGRIEVRDVTERIEIRLALTERRKLTDNSAIGLCVGVAASTNPRIGNTAKIGAALSYEF